MNFPMLEMKKFSYLVSRKLHTTGRAKFWIKNYGSKVLASFYKAVNGSKKLEGVLVERTDEYLVLDAGEEIKIENEKVATVRLVAEF